MLTAIGCDKDQGLIGGITAEILPPRSARSTGPRVEDRHAAIGKVSAVSGRDLGIVGQGNGTDEAVEPLYGAAKSLSIGDEGAIMDGG